MKTLTRILPVLFIVGLLASCECTCDKEHVKSEPNAVEPAADEDKSIEGAFKIVKDDQGNDKIQELTAEILAASGPNSIMTSSFGIFGYGDGTAPGMNISLEWNTSDVAPNELVYRLIGLDEKGKYLAHDTIHLSDINSNAPVVGIEIFVGPYFGNTAIGVAKVSDLPYGNQKMVLLANEIDGKVCKGGSGTGNQPALVGVNDARSATKTREGEGTYGRLNLTDVGVKVRLHYHKESVNEHFLVISSSLPTATFDVPDVHDICHWSTGQSLWGEKFDFSASGCP